MAAVRRLYIYLISAISLQAVTWALIALLRNLSIPSLNPPTTTIALEIAMIVIGLPIFLVHWLWSNRLVQRDAGELDAGLRRFYLYATLAGFLGPILASAYYSIAAIIGGAPLYLGILYLARGERLVFHIVPLIILSVLWWYHHKLLDAELDLTPNHEGNGVIERSYRLGFSAAGLILTSMGSIHILRLVLYLGQKTTTSIQSASYNPLAISLAQLLVGTAVWLAFWLHSQRMFNDPLSDERSSALRKFYLYAAVFAGVLGSVGYTATILAGIFRKILALPPQGDLRTPIPIMLVMAVVWAYHAHTLNQDQRQVQEAPQQAAIRRIYLYLVAGVGLAALLSGLGGVISVFFRSIDQVLGSNLGVQLAWFSAASLSGLPVWLYHWRQAQQAALVDDESGEDERTSLVRKIYLYFFILVATLTVLSGLVYIVYRIFSNLLGEPAPKISELGQAIAFCLIAVGVWLYHGACLRGDSRFSLEKRRQRLGTFNLLILETAKSPIGSELQSALQRAFPGLAPTLLSSSEIQEQSEPPAERLAQSDLILLPWSSLLEGDDPVIQTWIEAARTLPVKKLLLPARAESWEFAGVDSWSQPSLIQQTVLAVGQMIDGQMVKPKKPLSPGAVVGLVVAGLLGFSILLSLIGRIVDSFNR